jgi:pimeloyl-ACP methyl ester carboxylesterase
MGRNAVIHKMLKKLKDRIHIQTMFVVVFVWMLFASSVYAFSSEPEAVILLHGYGRTEYSMRPLQGRLEAAGFIVHNFDYPSMWLTPAELTKLLDQALTSCCSVSPRIHFVTHSLGGIIVRAYLSENCLQNMGRVVMLAPPNQGSELADLANESSLLRAILGPTVIQLGTGSDSLPNRLPPPWYELGVIAGIDNINPIGGLFVPAPSDGTVSVSRTQLDGMSDFITVRKSHTFIMRSAEVADYVIHFLRTGRFLPMPAPPAKIFQ